MNLIKERLIDLFEREKRGTIGSFRFIYNSFSQDESVPAGVRINSYTEFSISQLLSDEEIVELRMRGTDVPEEVRVYYQANKDVIYR